MAHDLANFIGMPDEKADAELFQCVIENSVEKIGYGGALALAGLMMVGLGICRPLYIWYKKKIKSKPD